MHGVQTPVTLLTWILTNQMVFFRVSEDPLTIYPQGRELKILSGEKKIKLRHLERLECDTNGSIQAQVTGVQAYLLDQEE
jgi:hypothetical protein